MRKDVELTGVSCAGRSIIEILWEDLDKTVDKLESPGALRGARPVDIGRAQGLAYAIAVMYNPYAPDFNAVRDEAMDRYDDRAGE